MEISVGHTPDSDDAFMFYGMFTGKVPSPEFTVNHVIEDIEKLNLKATNPELAKRLSLIVVFPWSTCAITPKLRIFFLFLIIFITSAVDLNFAINPKTWRALYNVCDI